MSHSENTYFRGFAWKSIRRNKGRSSFISLTVALAVTVSVWIMVFFQGVNTHMERAVVDTNTGFFQLQEPNFAKSSDSSRPLPVTEKLSTGLKNSPASHYSPELVFDGYLVAPEGAATLTVIGVDPELHRNVVPITQNLEAGTYFSSPELPTVVIGKELARRFNLGLGDSLVVNYQDHLGELRSEILLIEGIYAFNSKGFQSGHVYISQTTWQQLFMNAVRPGTFFNRIVILAPDLSGAAAFEALARGTGLAHKTWKNINPEIAVLIDFQVGLMNFCFVIIGITIVMTILTPVRMLWQERLKELRMLKILGLTSARMWKIAFHEIYLMMALCGSFSIFLVTLVVGINSYTGIDFGLIKEGENVERAGIQIPEEVYPILRGEHLVATAVFVVLVLGLSYAWSIHKTLKIIKLES